MYAMLGTRPDIAAAVSYVSRFSENPQQLHWRALYRRYLKGTVDHGILYDGKPLKSGLMELIGYTDADWGSDPTDRKSISGYVFHPHQLEMPKTANSTTFVNRG